MSAKESQFQAALIKKIKRLFPGCIVMKQDASYIVGIPDLVIFYEDKWAMLECKRSRNARHGPGQDYYVDICDQMSFARFIYPENEEEVLDDLQQSFQTRRATRNSRSKSARMAKI